jgi:ribose-phosphate pyrophosphokinase
MIDRPSSFIAAAEHCRLNCGAKDVYIVGTHGVFSDGSLEALTDSPYIDKIVVTNTYPIPPHRRTSKLVVIDISSIFAECIRRNHHGESISALFEQLASF